MGPTGSFGSSALLRDTAIVQATATAAVDSELFALSRDAFVRILTARTPRVTSEALTALLAVPALATLPRDALAALYAQRNSNARLAGLTPSLRSPLTPHPLPTHSPPTPHHVNDSPS